jgi:hypothetical protein
MEKTKIFDKTTPKRPRFSSDRPDEYGFDLGYKTLPLQVIKKLNTRSGSGLADEYYTIEKLESMYISLVDGLIGIQDGSLEVSTETIGDSSKYSYSEFEGSPADHVVYLDKSARPIQHMVSGLWENLAAPGVDEPAHSFVNIDKEIWLQNMNVPVSRLQNPKPEDYNFDNMDQELLKARISQLRAIYVRPDSVDRIDEDNPLSCLELPTILDGENVLIVDEVESSGYTLKIALELYKRAFPETNFATAYWVSPRKISWTVTEQDGTDSREFASSWVPFWYDAQTVYGRGIGDIDPIFSSASEDVRVRLGKFLLSAPINKKTDSGFEIIKDRRSADTYSDLDLLIDRYKEGKILYKPNPDRSDFEERAMQMNHLTSMSDYVKLVRSL